MGGAIYELGACGIRLLKPLKFIGKLTVAGRTYRVPARIWHEPIMKQVETSQIFDVETVGEMVSQFDRSKQVKVERHTSTVAEVDFASVPDVILFQSADFLDGVHKGRWSAANRAHRGYEISRRDACDLCCDIRQACNGQMAEGAVQAKSDIDRGVGLRQAVSKACDIECKTNSGKAGEASGRQPGALYLRLCDVKSTGGN